MDIGNALQTSKNIPHKVVSEDLAIKTRSSNHNSSYLRFRIAVYKTTSQQMHETFSLANKEEIGLMRWGVARCLLNLILIRLSKKTWQSLSGQKILYKYLTNLQLKRMFVVFHPCFPFLIAIIYFSTVLLTTF